MKGVALALAFLALPGTALAQAYQCAPPDRVPAWRAPEQDGPTRRLPVGGYTLAASWSPEYCRGARNADPLQCSGRYGRFGFVLHGLWPEGGRGPWPQWCASAPRPSPELVRRHLCMTPSARLLEHEWAKHGSCMARTPEGYFRVASILWSSVRWPDLDRLSRREGLTAGDLRRAFVESNPGWSTRSVGVFAGRNGWLRKVRLCYGRNFRPVACPRGRVGAPDSAPLKIWRGLTSAPGRSF